jgi:hypothetical protein
VGKIMGKDACRLEGKLVQREEEGVPMTLEEKEEK